MYFAAITVPVVSKKSEGKLFSALRGSGLLVGTAPSQRLLSFRPILLNFYRCFNDGRKIRM